MKVKILFLLLTVAFVNCARQGGIRGLVVARDTHIPISGVEVVVPDTDGLTVTDEEGMYTLVLPKSDFVLLFNAAGYESARVEATDMMRAKWYRIDVALIPLE